MLDSKALPLQKEVDCEGAFAHVCILSNTGRQVCSLRTSFLLYFKEFNPDVALGNIR